VLDRDFSERFSKELIEAFNSHDLDRIFDLYDDDFTMTSHYIKARMGIESGVLNGKEAVRPYWEKSLSMNPSLNFELVNIFVGVSSLAVFYKNIGRKLVCETFTFNNNNNNNNGKVTTGLLSPAPVRIAI
jgi:hypothetical protein